MKSVRLLTILIAVLPLAIAQPAEAGQASTSATVAGKATHSIQSPGAKSPTLQWEYTFTFRNICPAACGSSDFVEISLAINPAVEFLVVSDPDKWTTRWIDGRLTIRRSVGLDNVATLSLQLRAPQSRAKNGQIEWRASAPGLSAAPLAELDGPATLEDKPSPFTSLVGAGFSYLNDDFAEYSIDGNTLVIHNDSRGRPAALTGIGFDITPRMGIFAGIEFAQGTLSLVDAFTFGGTMKLGTDLRLAAGVSLAKGTELSAGFERAAAAYLKANPGKLPGVSVSADGLRLDGASAYDGLSTKDIGFAGKPIVDSFNTSFFVGVVFPISIKLGHDRNLADLKPKKD